MDEYTFSLLYVCGPGQASQPCQMLRFLISRSSFELFLWLQTVQTFYFLTWWYAVARGYPGAVMVDCLESLILPGSSDLIHLFEILTAPILDWSTHSLAPKTARVRIEKKGDPILSAPLVRFTRCHRQSSRAASDPRSLIKKFHHALLLPGS